ncbi:hypothetical protein [Myxococcus phage Mx1]|nr:hypothetical protein [Myxococcus phage Mx1]
MPKYRVYMKSYPDDGEFITEAINEEDAMYLALDLSQFADYATEDDFDTGELVVEEVE